MTFYVMNPDDPYNSLATLPGFTIEEAVDCIQKDSSFRDCVPMTAEERKRWNRKCDSVESNQYRDMYESIKETLMYTQYLDGNLDLAKISYSFWITGAYDTYSGTYAFGADTVGSYEFNLPRIAKKIGSKYYNNYAIYKGQRFKDFSALCTRLNELGMKEIDFTKEDLIESCNNDSYRVFRH
jgi:hypothetical protein